jgi:hypothetical protein
MSDNKCTCISESTKEKCKAYKLKDGSSDYCAAHTRTTPPCKLGKWESAAIMQRRVPVMQRPAAPVMQRPAAPVMQRPAAPVMQRPVPVMQRPVPVMQRPAAPVMQRPVPVMQRPVPVMQRPVPVMQRPVPVMQRPVAAVAPSAIKLKEGRMSAGDYYRTYGPASIGDVCDIKTDGNYKCLLLRANGIPYWAARSKTDSATQKTCMPWAPKCKA